MNQDISVGLVDDHALLRKGLASLLVSRGYPVLIEADNGQEFKEILVDTNMPQVLLLDINMPVMDGYATALWLKRTYPDMKVLALSMYDDEQAIIRMLHCGARGYLLKDCKPEELTNAIQTVVNKGFYHSELISSRLLHNMQGAKTDGQLELTDKEMHFLQLSCSEMTYKEIAVLMNLSPRTIDGYRDALFEKLGIKSRVGLVIYAVKNRLVQI